MTSFYAHTISNHQSEWEPLREHLHLVSAHAERFASKFDAAAWGRTLGWWHDLGKYSAQFQNYLVNSANTDVHQSEIIGRVDHSTAGAINAVRQFGPNRQPFSHALAFCIAGHHAGLANAIADGPPRSLSERLTSPVKFVSSSCRNVRLPEFCEALQKRHKDYSSRDQHLALKSEINDPEFDAVCSFMSSYESLRFCLLV